MALTTIRSLGPVHRQSVVTQYLAIHQHLFQLPGIVAVAEQVLESPLNQAPFGMHHCSSSRSRSRLYSAPCCIHGLAIVVFALLVRLAVLERHQFGSSGLGFVLGPMLHPILTQTGWPLVFTLLIHLQFALLPHAVVAVAFWSFQLPLAVVGVDCTWFEAVLLIGGYWRIERVDETWLRSGLALEAIAGAARSAEIMNIFSVYLP
eukprot:g22817.t1